MTLDEAKDELNKFVKLKTTMRPTFADILTSDDVQEIVRCGECIHWNAETKGCKRNPSVYRWYAKDFCSNGVR